MAECSFLVEQIDHVELFVPDRRAAAEWYRRVLGLEIIREFESWAEPEGGPLMISSDGGGAKLALFQGQPRGDRPTAGFHRVAFRVSANGFNEFRNHIRDNPVFDEHGRELRELKVIDHELAHSVYFCDPYGHWLEVTTYEVAREKNGG